MMKPTERTSSRANIPHGTKVYCYSMAIKYILLAGNSNFPNVSVKVLVTLVQNSRQPTPGLQVPWQWTIRRKTLGTHCTPVLVQIFPVDMVVSVGFIVHQHYQPNFIIKVVIKHVMTQTSQTTLRIIINNVSGS